MSETMTAATLNPPPPVQRVFAPMYDDEPTSQIVFGLEVMADDNLTASITAGTPYFKVSAIDVCNWFLTNLLSCAPHPSVNCPARRACRFRRFRHLGL
jgi:hypothetical protein